MDITEQKLKNYFEDLELSPEVCRLYTSLRRYGSQTISELSRTSGVERTRIYRLHEELSRSNLIEFITDHNRTIYQAAPISNIRILLSKKEQSLIKLRSNLDEIEHALSIDQLSSPATNVKFYTGAEGVKQMQWNLLRSTTDVLSIMNRPMMDVTGGVFFRRWGERWNEKRVNVRLLYTQEFVDASTDWHKKNPGNAVKNHINHLLNPGTASITHCSDIYNDVVAYYNWHDNDVFGIEIHNAQIADMQRVFFEMLWAQSKPNQRDIGIKVD